MITAWEVGGLQTGHRTAGGTKTRFVRAARGSGSVDQLGRKPKSVPVVCCQREVTYFGRV